MQQRASAPDFWNDANRARDVIARTNGLRAFLEPHAAATRQLADAVGFLELAELESDERERATARREAAQLLAAGEKLLGDLETRGLLGGPMDAHNAYLTLHAGAGGTESCDWADMLLRMYTRYLEKKGFGYQTLDVQPGEEAGVKSATLLVTGPYAYGYLKAERGVHRLVRISPFDSNQRRHTSFAALDVTAEIDDTVEIEINEKDLRVDTYRSGGAGGQHVNKTDSAIRIVHLPTGTVVACQAERSQHANRDKAMKMLKARLYEMEQDKKKKEMDQFYGEKGEIAWGRQIRSYVLQPYRMVKDLRTGVETSQTQDVLDGDLDAFIEAWLRQPGRAG